MELIHPEVTSQALSILRKLDNLQGYVITLLALVVYVHSTEIENRSWNGIAAGRQKRFIEGVFAFGAPLLLLFGPILRWI